MILHVYTIRDSKTKVFGNPFNQKSYEEATRSFHSLVNDPQSMPNKYPEDYDLYYLGSYDDHSGKYNLLDTPEHKIKAISLIKEKSTVQPALTERLDLV